jgi:hypothetical protein
MNYFAHACPFLDDPYFMAGACVPDWLAVVDRRVRVRTFRAEPLAADADRPTACVARGVMQHLRDDARFHETRAFTELALQLTVDARNRLDGDAGFRPSFLGHLLVEVLLDAALIADDPLRLETYYRRLEAVDGSRIEEAVSRMANRPAERLAWMIARFCQERILWDYLEDGKLLGRLNQVMRRVTLPPLPDDFQELFPEARQKVAGRRAGLLEGIPTKLPSLHPVCPQGERLCDTG